MSRIGKKIITLPKGVSVTIQEQELEVKGPEGQLEDSDSRRHQLQTRRRRAAR